MRRLFDNDEKNDMELTKAQIERQDFVDNTIFDLLETLNPTDNMLNWDIEIIGTIRDLINNYFFNNGICSEQKFYPFIKE